MIRIHVGDLATGLVRPGGGVSECCALRKKLFDAFTCSIGELNLGKSGDDFMAFAAPRVSRTGAKERA